jgi:hypothetical protein
VDPVTEDSDTGAMTDPQSLDQYVYAMNNPLTILDSTGHAGNPLGKGTTASSNANMDGTGTNSIFKALSSFTSSISNIIHGVAPRDQAVTIAVIAVIAAVVVTGGIGLVAAPEIGLALGGAYGTAGIGEAIVVGMAGMAGIVSIAGAAATGAAYALTSGGATANGELFASERGALAGLAIANVALELLEQADRAIFPSEVANRNLENEISLMQNPQATLTGMGVGANLYYSTPNEISNENPYAGAPNPQYISPQSTYEQSYQSDGSSDDAGCQYC